MNLDINGLIDRLKRSGVIGELSSYTENDYRSALQTIPTETVNDMLEGNLEYLAQSVHGIPREMVGPLVQFVATITYTSALQGYLFRDGLKEDIERDLAAYKVYFQVYYNPETGQIELSAIDESANPRMVIGTIMTPDQWDDVSRNLLARGETEELPKLTIPALLPADIEAWRTSGELPEGFSWHG